MTDDELGHIILGLPGFQKIWELAYNQKRREAYLDDERRINEWKQNFSPLKPVAPMIRNKHYEKTSEELFLLLDEQGKTYGHAEILKAGAELLRRKKETILRDTLYLWLVRLNFAVGSSFVHLDKDIPLKSVVSHCARVAQWILSMELPSVQRWLDDKTLMDALVRISSSTCDLEARKVINEATTKLENTRTLPREPSTSERIRLFAKHVKNYLAWEFVKQLHAQSLNQNNQQHVNDGGKLAADIVAADEKRNAERAAIVKLVEVLGPDLSALGYNSEPLHRITQLADSGGGPIELGKIWPDIRSGLLALADKLHADSAPADVGNIAKQANWNAVRIEGRKAIDKERSCSGEELSERLERVTGSLKNVGHGALGYSLADQYLNRRDWKETLINNVSKEIGASDQLPLQQEERQVLTDFIKEQEQKEKDWLQAVDHAENGRGAQALTMVRSFHPTRLAKDLERALLRTLPLAETCDQTDSAKINIAKQFASVPQGTRGMSPSEEKEQETRQEKNRQQFFNSLRASDTQAAALFDEFMNTPQDKAGQFIQKLVRIRNENVQDWEALGKFNAAIGTTFLALYSAQFSRDESKKLSYRIMDEWIRHGVIVRAQQATPEANIETASLAHSNNQPDALGADQFLLTWRKEDGKPCWGSKPFKGQARAEHLLWLLASANGKLHWETIAKELLSASWDDDDEQAANLKKKKALNSVQTAFSRMRKAAFDCWSWKKDQLPDRDAAGFYRLNLLSSLIVNPPAYGKLTKSQKRPVIFNSDVASKAENSDR
jgi:hypothetical protein